MEIFKTQEAQITIRIVLAILCGGLLGLEREKKRMPAGFRTYMLVCVGAAVVMIINYLLIDTYPGTDPSRMGAQVISGIGFLGIGTIIVTGDNKVKGLTTAAGLWATATVGLAIGAGYYYLGLLVSFLIYILMKVLHPMDRILGQKAKNLNLYIEFSDLVYLSQFVKYLRSINISINDMEVKKSSRFEDASIAVFFCLFLDTRKNHSEFIAQVSDNEGIVFIQEI